MICTKIWPGSQSHHLLIECSTQQHQQLILTWYLCKTVPRTWSLHSMTKARYHRWPHASPKCHNCSTDEAETAKPAVEVKSFHGFRVTLSFIHCLHSLVGNDAFTCIQFSTGEAGQLIDAAVQPAGGQGHVPVEGQGCSISTVRCGQLWI